ncbi:MAG TPA: glycosyltransferase family 2 protein [Acidobacteriaceae bacterium]|nr:glycosyltransferase family 2 protein [Acidobacteriaceae bacterium]
MDISVAMCTYNGSRFLPAQLQSIAGQTMLPCELVVCDDGSSDSTSEIVKSFGEVAAFPVRFIRNERTLGSTENFAKAICLCRGDAIALCDQDDIWRKDKLERMAEVLESEPDVGGVFSDALLVDQNSKTLPESMWEQRQFDARLQAVINDRQAAPLQLLEKNVVTGATFMFRSHFVSRVTPIPPEWVHDAWIALLIATQTKLRALPAQLMSYRLHGAQQIGIKAASWHHPFHEERKKTLAFHDTLIQRWRSMTERLVALGVDPMVIGQAQERLKFLETRTALRQQDPWSRFVSATVTLPEYFKFSKGLLSFYRDVTRS